MKADARARAFDVPLWQDRPRPSMRVALPPTPRSDPVFVWTTADDALVPFTHSKLFAEACRRAGVPVEFTLFSHGPHGMGLALDAPDEARGWTTQLLAWLAEQWGA